MDDFDGFDADGPGAEFDDGLDDGPASAFDDFDDQPETGESDLDAFALDDPGSGGVDAGQTGGLDPDIEDAFDVDAEFDDAEPAAEPAEDETAYTATYEDMVVAEADNPPAFPPELDMDVPEPVDGYPWVDMDTLGQTESDPWFNTVESSDFDTANVDGVVSEALSRFWDH